MANELVDEGYVPYLINQFYANFKDSILFANEMNRLSSASERMQYHFYYFALDKRNRFYKKAKHVSESISIIKEYYGYSERKARDVLSILLPHIDQLKEELEKGGRRHGREHS